ncbi:unnamed protein product [Closterium sp. Naga37s-1]|nr:unnamed protein product [Closterium sp. Naga37s-1]
MVQNTCSKLTARYVEYGVHFVEDSDRLTAFLEERTHPPRCEVKVEGMESKGNAIKHTFMLHELPIPSVDSTPDLELYVRLATKFAQEPRRPAKEVSGVAKGSKRKGLAAEADDQAPEIEAAEKAYPAVKKRHKRDKVLEIDSEDDGLDVRATLTLTSDSDTE